MKEFGLAAGMILLFIVALCVVPLAVIWSVNTLFNCGIAFSFETWLAAAVLCGVFAASGRTSK